MHFGSALIQKLNADAGNQGAVEVEIAEQCVVSPASVQLPLFLVTAKIGLLTSSMRHPN